MIAAERRFQPTRSPLPEASTKPLVLVEGGQRGLRIMSVNAAAEAAGVRAGDALADARAVLPSLAVRDTRAQADKAALRKLAHWLGRYGIARNAYGVALETGSGQRIRCYGLWVDIAGVAHLYGGERVLLADLAARLARFGLTARLGLADTLGAAHALAWYGSGCSIAPAGDMTEVLAPLPVAALRLDRARVHLLSRLGFKQIGALTGVPRLSLEKRFRSSQDGQRVLLRLDQALGLRAEPRRPLIEPPVLTVRQSFAAPLISSDALEHETAALVGTFCTRLEAQNVGTQAVRLTLYRSDGTTCQVVAAFSRAVRSTDHIFRLLREKLSGVDLGFGVDLMTLDAVRTQQIACDQATLTAGGCVTHVGRNADLVDRLVNRLGSSRVTRLAARASHRPERRSVRVEALAAGPCDFAGSPARAVAVSAAPPAFLLAVPEAITVLAEIPTGAPARFIWRRLAHRVVRAEGPQRIAPEWWLELVPGSRTRPRDYYRVEDDAGARFWVFRDGDYSSADDVPPAWFVHGLVA
jgi:protein ImuB